MTIRISIYEKNAVLKNCVIPSLKRAILGRNRGPCATLGWSSLFEYNRIHETYEILPEIDTREIQICDSNWYGVVDILNDGPYHQKWLSLYSQGSDDDGDEGWWYGQSLWKYQNHKNIFFMDIRLALRLYTV